MVYLGSKRRYAKDILNIVLAGRKPGQYFIEPFVGGANIFDKVEEPKLGADINFYLIQLLRAASSGWLPPAVITEKQYNDIKNNKDDYPPELVAYVGFCVSFGAKWFAGYARYSDLTKDHSEESYNSAVKNFPKLHGAKFLCCDYDSVPLPPNSIIYCDPPYENTTKYTANKGFDHAEFWAWARVKTLEGHSVYVSEYNAPADFVEVWRKTAKISLDSSAISDRTEKLFTYCEFLS